MKDKPYTPTRRQFIAFNIMLLGAALIISAAIGMLLIAGFYTIIDSL